ncbi:MAG: lanthionine synthetase LanC family protein, partial [Solirubrobacteraceae bacterium]
DRIVADAVWHGDRCNWTGAVVDPALPWRLEYRALEPNLYDGTAGVGLFLAQLAVVNGDAAVRRTARGALRQGIARAPSLPPGRRDGFHAGVLGIAWAAAHAARLLDDDELWAGGRRIAAEARPPAAAERCPDVVTGSAGTILALLALAELDDEPALVSEARATGDQLIDRARVTENGWSWADPSRGHRGHLCGLSHGSAGIGWGLLELFVSTGDERFREAAEGAFAYERSWFDARSGTWADLRAGGSRRGASRRFRSPAAGTWCHGEAGIALTRLRAAAVLGPATYRDEAERALEATRRELVRAQLQERDDLTLCHGVAGGADALLCGVAALGGRRPEAAELGAASIERYGGVRGDWPCGAAGGTSPGLFRGLSGIAWWLLRLHDPAIPSPITLPVRS